MYPQYYNQQFNQYSNPMNQNNPVNPQNNYNNVNTANNNWSNGNGMNTVNQPMYQQPSNFMNSYRPVLSGRTINDISEVTAQEVAMDGSVTIFPKADYSCIYTKAWNSNGTISTFKYVPETEKVADNGNVDVMSNICARLDKIEKLLTPKPSNNNNANRKKEVTND